jgi:hypothetical protein
MFLFKASGKTYRRVVRESLHAFPLSPLDADVGQFVLLSKNREDCALTEKQIQNVAKVLAVRPAGATELEARFPGVDAGSRFRFMIQLYWLEALDRPFNLADIEGVNFRRYDPVQDFARLDHEDEQLVINHMVRTNERVILSYLNRDDLPPELGDPDAG